MKFIVHKAATRGYFDHGWLKTEVNPESWTVNK